MVLSAVVPLMGLAGPEPDFMLLIWPAFVFVWLFRAPLGLALTKLPWSPNFSLFLAFVLVGQLTEVLAWGSDVWLGRAYPEVFHPQLGVDLTLALGFYGGLGVGWALLCRRFDFTLFEVFAIAGIYGVLVEQDGAILTMAVGSILTNPMAAIFIAGYVFVIYGSFSALAIALFLPRLTGRSRHWFRYVLAIAACIILPRLGFALILGIFALFGGLPEPRSALDFPFW